MGNLFPENLKISHGNNMNILITGGNGFIARNIYNTIKDSYNVLLTDRRTLDVLDTVLVEKFFNDNDIDIVIHTAVSGGSRIKDDNIDTLMNNLAMFNNLMQNKHKFGSLIHFGSGAEFDRRTNITSVKENDESCPVDYYGLSKKIIKREIDKIENFYNLRIFGCFGEDELETRFIKSAVESVKSGHAIKIHQNRYMDFFYIEDLCRVIEHYIKNISKKDLPKDMNLCYNKHKSLLDIANKINKLMNKPYENVVVQQSGYYTEYTGNGEMLDTLGLELDGLDKGLERCINV
jgi:nucleoside-diphosphate-sugar epimerase